LRKLGDIEVVEERFVNDGNIWTASSVSEGFKAISVPFTTTDN
jgi:hypothetical protein